MLSATLKFLIRDLYSLVQRAESWLIALAAQRRCAMRLDRLADRILAMGEKINALRESMQQVAGDEPVDQDGALRAALKGLKEDIGDIRCQLTSMDTPHTSARIRRAMQRLSQIAGRTYASADKLQWEIVEHDGMFEVQRGNVSYSAQPHGMRSH